jgi:hypothetical protein
VRERGKCKEEGKVRRFRLSKERQESTYQEEKEGDIQSETDRQGESQPAREIDKQTDRYAGRYIRR